MFDPYQRWLGIPKGQRPPTYYQLLGVSPVERQREVIAEAALRQTSEVRAYQTGPHAERCVELLNEIARARMTLLDPVKRKAYDASLNQTPTQIEVEVPAPQTAEPPNEPVMEYEAVALEPPRRTVNPGGHSRWPDVWSVLCLWTYVVLLLLGGFVAFRLSQMFRP
jgi:hypothetical protein